MGKSEEEAPSSSEDMSSLPGVPPGYVGFVRPPPGPPPTARQRRFEPLTTVGGVMIILGVFAFFGGAVLTLFLAVAGWGPIGLTMAFSGIGLVVLGVVVHAIARRLQRG